MNQTHEEWLCLYGQYIRPGMTLIVDSGELEKLWRDRDVARKDLVRANARAKQAHGDVEAAEKRSDDAYGQLDAVMLWARKNLPEPQVEAMEDAGDSAASRSHDNEVDKLAQGSPSDAEARTERANDALAEAKARTERAYDVPAGILPYAQEVKVQLVNLSRRVRKLERAHQGSEGLPPGETQEEG